MSIALLTCLILLVQQSYAYLHANLEGTKTYSLKVKSFSLRLDESSTSENINIENQEPVSDNTGKMTKAYTFAVINESTTPTGYVLYLDDVKIDDEINRMKDTCVKYQLIKNGNEQVGYVAELGVNPFRILNSGIINANTTDTYSLRFWIDEKADISANQKFSVKIRIVATSTDAIEAGKLVFGDTIVTDENSITQMTSEQLQTYVDKALESKVLEKTLTIKQETLDEAHPVGSIYISTTNTNPSSLFGGTWESYGAGRTLVGVDTSDTDFSTVSKTGGTKTNNLSHSHTVNSHTHSLNGHTHGLSKGYANVDINVVTSTIIVKRQGTITSWPGMSLGGIAASGTSTATGEHNNAALGGTTDAASGNTGATSPGTSSALGTAVTNLQPYITVYMWKRIS